MAEEKQKVYTEQEIRDVIKRMNNFGPKEGDIAVCHWNPNIEKWFSDDKFQMIVREILTQDADLRKRVEGLQCGEDWIVVQREVWNKVAEKFNEMQARLEEMKKRFNTQHLYGWIEIAEAFNYIATGRRD